MPFWKTKHFLGHIHWSIWSVLHALYHFGTMNWWFLNSSKLICFLKEIILGPLFKTYLKAGKTAPISNNHKRIKVRNYKKLWQLKLWQLNRPKIIKSSVAKRSTLPKQRNIIIAMYKNIAFSFKAAITKPALIFVQFQQNHFVDAFLILGLKPKNINNNKIVLYRNYNCCYVSLFLFVCLLPT